MGGVARTPTAFGVDSLTGVIFQTASLDYEDTNEYGLVVSARDSGGLISTATVTLKVIDVNEAPAIVGQSVNVREDAKVGSPVGRSFLSITTDPDINNEREILKFALLNEEKTFAIDPTTGQVSVIAPLDYETKSMYLVQVKVADIGGLAGRAELIVNILDVNEPPKLGAFNLSVPEDLTPGFPIGRPILVTDEDVGSTLHYDLVGTSDSLLGCIRINATSGQLVLRIDCSLDFESPSGNTLPLAVRVSDGEFTVAAVGVLSIVDVNEPPALVGSAPTLLYENSAADTFVTHVLVNDPDKDERHQFWICEQSYPNTFRVEMTGISSAELMVKNSSALNYERLPSFWVDVCVQDKGGLTGRARYSIDLLNVVEPPYFSQDVIQFSVEESVAVGKTIGLPLLQYVVDEENWSVTVGCSVDIRVHINSTCGRAASFTVDSCGSLSLSSGALDYETMPICVVYVDLPQTSIYNSNALSSQRSAAAAVILTVTDVNEPPTFSQKLYQLSVAESAATGTMLGVLVASDADTGSTLSFRIANALTSDQGPFTVSVAGAITVQGHLTMKLSGLISSHLTCLMSVGHLTTRL